MIKFTLPAGFLSDPTLVFAVMEAKLLANQEEFWRRGQVLQHYVSISSVFRFFGKNLTGWNQTHAAAAEGGCGLILCKTLAASPFVLSMAVNTACHFEIEEHFFCLHVFDGFLKLWPCVFKHVERLLMRWSKCRTKAFKKNSRTCFIEIARHAAV